MEIIKEGHYPDKNKIKCQSCDCEFRYYNTEIIVDMTTPEEEEIFGGFGVFKSVKCPQCGATCSISCEFEEYKSIFEKIKEWFYERYKKSK